MPSTGPGISAVAAPGPGKSVLTRCTSIPAGTARNPDAAIHLIHLVDSGVSPRYRGL
jgi:hypothetical protein